MAILEDIHAAEAPALSNGPGAAAILSAGIGCFAIGIFGFAADKSAAIKSHFILYKPTGPLSGQTTLAIILWLVSWAILAQAWKGKTVSLKRITLTAFILLGLSLLLTFPPLIDLL
ncbi:MAG: hypothetical protein P4L10_13495 [Acidobacteriaceae bacterium]|jgi:hypothetical protein|nr:hypothetical protein [Acidobacteriaceae bacterium]